MSIQALPVLQREVCCPPLAGSRLSDAEAVDAATVFKALADPHRVRLVSLLAAERSACVCELTAPLGLAQATVSHHLKKLLDAGLVRREQRGTWAYYSLDRGALARAAAILATEGETDEHARA